MKPSQSNRTRSAMLRTRLALGFGLVCLALVTVPLTMYLMHSNQALRSARLEHAGIVPLQALLRVVQLLQQHRGLSSGVLVGNATMEAQRAAKQIETDKAVEAFDAIVTSELRDPALTAAWRRMVENWRALASRASSRSITGQESFSLHVALIDENLELLDLTLDHFGLSYDQSDATYHVIMAMLVHMPNLSEFLGQARARGVLHLSQQHITPTDRAAVIGLISNIERQHRHVGRELAKASTLNPTLKPDLDDIAQRCMTLTQKAVHLAATQVVDAVILRYSPIEYFTVFTRTIDGQFALLEKAMVDLEGALQARISALLTRQIYTIGSIVLVMVFAVWLTTRLLRALTQDVTALEQSEAVQRRYADELEAAIEQLTQAQTQIVKSERLRAVGELASGVAHDFNNTLAAILGQVILLQARLERGAVASEELRRCLYLLERAALDGAEIVRRIRRSTSSDEDAPFVSVDLNRVIEQVLETTRPRWKDQAEAEGLRITVVRRLTPVPPVLGNASELREALTNLLFNALDAMPTGGTIMIGTTAVPCTAVPAMAAASAGLTDECVQLAVSDTGVGMSPAVQARLFEPFFTTKGDRGTGLGLSMVYGIVCRHQGSIAVDSVVGAGTTITLCLSAASAAASEALPSVAPPSSEPGSLRVLVIDDEPVLAEVLGHLLHGLGHTAVMTASSVEGLARFVAEPFDILLTDLSMSQMSGWEVAAAAKAHDPACPVILVTGWDETAGAETLEGTGVDLVLAKPYTLVQLRQSLAHARARTKTLKEGG